jgi:hypothetical protein
MALFICRDERNWRNSQNDFCRPVHLPQFFNEGAHLRDRIGDTEVHEFIILIAVWISNHARCERHDGASAFCAPTFSEPHGEHKHVERLEHLLDACKMFGSRRVHFRVGEESIRFNGGAERVNDPAVLPASDGLAVVNRVKGTLEKL